LQNTPHQAWQLPALQLTPVSFDADTARFDLTLSLTESDNRLSGEATYSTDLFEATTIACLLQHYQTLLAGILLHPELPLAQLPLLSAAERQTILLDWNDTACAYEPQAGLHHLIEAQVTRSPQATALVFDHHHLTYLELNRRANQLAHHLRQLGVGPDLPVAILMERSVELAVALLAVLKAGG